MARYGIIQQGSILQVAHDHQRSNPQPLAHFATTHAQAQAQSRPSSSPASRPHPPNETASAPFALFLSCSPLSMSSPSHESHERLRRSVSLSLWLARRLAGRTSQVERRASHLRLTSGMRSSCLPFLHSISICDSQRQGFAASPQICPSRCATARSGRE